MKICFGHTDTEYRSYKGFDYSGEECEQLMCSEVRSNLLDQEEKDAFTQDLSDLAGLPATGFESERLLADIQAIEEENPIDLRTWRIGEAFAEVVLELELKVRFHWNELRDARNPRGNKTGADLVGFVEIDGDVLFLFGEAKTSSEIANRPPQVMTGGGQMEDQLKDLYFNKEKRNILIRYLASKTRNLNSQHPFKEDYKKALKNYYLSYNPNYQLIGVLVRDVDADEKDVKESYDRLKTSIEVPKGLKLIACYIPIAKSNWSNLIDRGVKE
ncbi:MAG: hypothetical protein AAGF96_05025 [Bacteroidota bacterium]